jgi:hypothetical protein
VGCKGGVYKNLGLGHSFNFRRIECDLANAIAVDEVCLRAGSFRASSYPWTVTSTKALAQTL